VGAIASLVTGHWSLVTGHWSLVTGHCSRYQDELRFTRWYEVIASYLEGASDGPQEETVSVCKRLWGQPFAAPIFSLLLHRWLLSTPAVSLKHLNVMVSGCRQLFLGDVDTGSTAFEPLFDYLLDWVVRQYSGDGSVERETTDKNHQLLGLCASFLPYYSEDDDAFLGVFDRIGASTTASSTLASSLSSSSFSSSSSSLNASSDFSAVDFAVGRAVDALSKDVRSDGAATKYLHRLASLKAHVKGLRLSTRIRLQGAVYSLTQPGGACGFPRGEDHHQRPFAPQLTRYNEQHVTTNNKHIAGPRYASKDVNRLAFRTLDELFPHGKRTRRAINLGFGGLFVFSRVTGVLYAGYIRVWLLFFGVVRWLVGVFGGRRRRG